MPNGRPTVAGVDKRVAVLESEFVHFSKDIKEDLAELKTAINPMSMGWLEFTRRLNKVYDVFPQDQELIRDLREAECPARKVMPDDNGEHNKRWLDQKKYKMMIWGLIATLTGLILSNMATCAWVSNNFNEIIQSMPK